MGIWIALSKMLLIIEEFYSLLIQHTVEGIYVSYGLKALYIYNLIRWTSSEFAL